MYLTSKLTIILAALLSYIDVNDNLNLVKGDTQWKQQLWLDLFENRHITFYPYSELQSITRTTELSQIPVAKTGFDNRKFTARVPFSWVIRTMIEELFHENDGTGNKLQELIELKWNVHCNKSILEVFLKYNVNNFRKY